MECGVWRVECGVWGLEFGVWGLEFGVWRVEGDSVFKFQLKANKARMN